MSTDSLYPNLFRKEIISQTDMNGIYSLAALLLLNLGVVFWTGGFGSFTSQYMAGESNMLTKPKQTSSNPFENLLIGQSENQEAQTITFNPLTPVTYGDPVITLSATASSGLPITFESDDPSVATISGNSLTIVGAGTANITASQDGDETFDPAPEVSQVLTVNKAILSAKADNKTKIFGDPNPALTITYTGFKGTDDASVLDTPPTIATTVTQFSPVDSYDISFMTGGSDHNYTFSLTDGTLTITKAPLSVTTDNKTKIYGDANPPLSLSYTGLKGTDDALVIDMPPSISTEATQFSAADSYPISFLTAGADDNYTFTSYTEGSLTITKASLTATADNKTRAYGAPDPVFTITYTGFKGSDDATVIDVPPVLATDATQFSPVNDYTIAFVTDGDDNNYEISGLNDGTLTIIKANQTIDFPAITGKTKFDPPFTPTATATSGLPVAFSSSDPGILSFSGTTATIHSSGTVIITASQAGDTNYNPADDVEQEILVNDKMYQTITFNELPTKAFGAAPFDLTATATSGLPISYTSSNPLVATITGSTVTVTGVGTTTITASQSGNDSYEPAPHVDRELVVSKGNQSITFAPLEDKILGSPPFNLTATASSGLPVSYVSSNPEIATIEGSLVILHAAGSVTLTASQPGNDFYNTAEDVDQELVVVKINQEITFAEIADKTVGDPPFSISASSSSDLEVAFEAMTSTLSVNGNQVTILSAGPATIRATQSGNDEYNAAEPVLQSFCINPAKPTISVTNYPGPEPLLTSSASTGNQWYLNGLPIPGATNSAHTAVAPGAYSVKVSVETCESLASEQVAILITGDIQEPAIDFEMHPNPVEKQLEVDFMGFGSGEITVVFVDPLGRIIERHGVQNGRETFDLHHFAPGTYWILATQSRYKITKQFVKK